MVTIIRSRSQTRPLTARIAKQLFIHNIHVNGSGAVVYCHGLSASRYIEYAGAIAFLLLKIKRGDKILEVGCGHSILPTFWQRLQIDTIVLDTNRNALKWQARKSKEIANAISCMVLADMRYLPLRDQSMMGISCISAIEHIQGNGDIETASEIGRILKDSGACVISVPLALHESYLKFHWAAEIPPLMQSLFHPYLPAILRKLQVDRTSSYSERFFSQEDMARRIVVPSRCIIEDRFVLKSGRLTKFIHQKIIPTGFLSLLEYLIAKFLPTSRDTEGADAIVIELKKGELKEKDRQNRRRKNSNSLGAEDRGRREPSDCNWCPILTRTESTVPARFPFVDLETKSFLHFDWINM
jgi:ubiquinone/menaquinone biosynthesis C-methylase UbiE